MKNPFRLPGPEALGYRPALESREFSPDTTSAYTWEDHDKYLKTTYPVRYRLRELWDNFRHSLYPIQRFFYYIRCHLQPSYRFHMLDLRDPYGPDGGYLYGYADPRAQIVYAAFAILVQFVEREMPHLKERPIRQETVANSALDLEALRALDDTWHQAWTEIHELYRWWTVGRKAESLAADALYDTYVLAGRDISSSKEDREIAKALWLESRSKEESREEEMLTRLIAVRKAMWT